MGDSYATILASIESRHDFAVERWLNASNYITLILGATTWTALRGYTASFAEQISACAGFLCMDGWFGYENNISAFNALLNPTMACKFITAADIPDPTMQQIINAMFLANKTQVTSFVGLMDAYRQSIWNMPFNAEMWAAVARGFQQWP